MRRSKRISPKESALHILDLLTAFSLIKSQEEVANFIADLLTESEVSVLAKRLRIAKLLLSGETMDAVVEETRAGKNTVAKIAHWLDGRGIGFRKVIEKLPKDRKPQEFDSSSWGQLKRTYKSYFTLFDALDSLFSEKGYSENQKNEVIKVVSKLREKRTASKEVDEAYRRQ